MHVSLFTLRRTMLTLFVSPNMAPSGHTNRQNGRFIMPMRRTSADEQRELELEEPREEVHSLGVRGAPRGPPEPGQPRLERARRAELAEPGLLRPPRDAEHDAREPHELEVPDPVRRGELREPELVDELLEPPERAEPPAREAADEDAERPDEPEHVERELPHDDEVLEGADRARAPRERARVAVERGDADALQGALVERGRGNRRVVGVRRDEERRLDGPSDAVKARTLEHHASGRQPRGASPRRCRTCR